MAIPIAATVAAGLGSAAGLATASAADDVHASSVSRYRCASALDLGAPAANIRLFSRSRPRHIRLAKGESLKVITRDHSYLGVMAAAQKRKSHVLCQAHETGTKHRKVVVFAGFHRGRTYVYAVPRVAPGTGAAYSSLHVRVT
jgi:hypothetical protein